MLVNTKARIGVFSIALGAYLPQFPSLVPEFEAQYADFKTRIPDTVELIDGGLVTTKEKAMAAGDKFRAADVDLVILQLLTYATSYNMLPAVRDLDVPVVLVNLQKKKAPDYPNTDTATWLGELYACGAVGEMVADLERAGKRHAVITGVVEGGDPAVDVEIADWCKAAQVRRRFRDTNLGEEIVHLGSVKACRAEIISGALQILQQVSQGDRKSTRLNSSHTDSSRMPSSA